MSESEGEVLQGKPDLRKKERFFQNINEANKKYQAYVDKNKDTLEKIPEVKSVVYNKIFYPIIYEINNFYYLGGEHVYFILKSKCHLKSTGKSYYYEAIASEEDIEMGKSPIIPVACPYHKRKYKLNDGAKFKVKL